MSIIFFSMSCCLQVKERCYAGRMPFFKWLPVLCSHQVLHSSSGQGPVPCCRTLGPQVELLNRVDKSHFCAASLSCLWPLGGRF